MDDVLEENNLDTASDNSGLIPLENFIKAIDITTPHAKKMLEKGKIVIFDCCFYHERALKYLIDKINFPHYIFTLKVSLETCILRDKNRQKTLGEDAARAVYKFVSKNNFGTIIDAEKSLTETSEIIISHLPEQKNTLN